MTAIHLRNYVLPYNSKIVMLALRRVERRNGPATIRLENDEGTQQVLQSSEHVQAFVNSIIDVGKSINSSIDSSINSSSKRRKLQIHLSLHDLMGDENALHQILSAINDLGRLYSLHIRGRTSSALFSTIRLLLHKSDDLQCFTVCTEIRENHDFEELLDFVKQHPSIEMCTIRGSGSLQTGEITLKAAFHSPNQPAFTKHLHTEAEKNNNLTSVSDFPKPLDVFVTVTKSFVQNSMIPSVIAFANERKSQKMYLVFDFTMNRVQCLQRLLSLEMEEKSSSIPRDDNIGTILAKNTVSVQLGLEGVTFTDQQAAGLSHMLSTSSWMSHLCLKDCQLSDKAHVSLLSTLHGLRNSLKGLHLIGAHIPNTISFGLCLYQLLVTDNFLEDLEIWRKLGANIPDYPSYAVARSLLHNSSLSSLTLRSHYPARTGYDEFEKALQSKLALENNHHRSGRCYTPLDGLDLAQTCIASMLASSLNVNQSLQTLILHGITTNEVLVHFRRNLRCNAGVQKLELRNLTYPGTGGEEAEKDANKVLAMASEYMAAHCTSLQKLYWKDEDGTYGEEYNVYEKTIKSFLRFNRNHYRDRIQNVDTTKEAAVETLVDFRENVACLYEALLINPGLFFSSTGTTSSDQIPYLMSVDGK